MRPFLPLLACALAVAASAEPPERPAPKPKSLKERVCSEGAYLRGPRSAAADLPGTQRVEGGEQGGEGSGLFRFTPPKEGCEQSVAGFFRGAGMGFEISPAFETNAAGAREELTPEKASARMVRLRSLSTVAAGDSRVADRFFENRLNQGDVTAMAGLDASRGLSQAPGLSSYYVSDGGTRVPFTYTPTARRTGVAADTVPGPREPATFNPAPGRWNVPPSEQAPVSRSWSSRAADYTSQLGDWAAGSPVAREEGRPILPPANPNYPQDASINKELLDAAGLTRRCKARNRCFGTQRMVDILTAAGGDYQRYMPGAPPMIIGDISQLGGGPISGHVSHQRGVDVDVMFHGTGRNWDVQRHTMMAAAVARRCAPSGPGALKYILIDRDYHAALRAGLQRLVQEGVIDAATASRASAAIRHWPNHYDHFHFRIY